MGIFTGGGGFGGSGRGVGAGRSKPDDHTRRSLRWSVTGEPDAIERALARGSKKGCKAANEHLSTRGGTKARGEMRAQKEGILVLVRLDLHAERLDGTPVGAAVEAFAREVEAALAEAGCAFRRLPS